MRRPETLPMSERKSLAIHDVLGAFRQTVTYRQTLGYAAAAGGVRDLLCEAPGDRQGVESASLLR
jgi:MFS transporter, DHA1 family, multidrug resistance protein